MMLRFRALSVFLPASAPYSPLRDRLYGELSSAYNEAERRDAWQTFDDMQDIYGEPSFTDYRSPLRSPFPPAFDFPLPQNLEDLLLQQSQTRRRSDLVQSFRLTNCRLDQEKLEHATAVLSEACDSRIIQYHPDLKQTWRDGVTAIQQLRSGTLPRELHSVLGIARVASAIRFAISDVDTPAASEEKFLSDLGRWRQLLPNDSHASFDYYADILWDNRPSSDLAWREPHDADTLVYFQGLLTEMLSHVAPVEEAELVNFSSSGDALRSSGIGNPLLPLLSLDPTPSGIENSRDVPNQDEPEHTDLAELALYAAGAIFALILAFLLCKFRSLTLPKPRLRS